MAVKIYIVTFVLWHHVLSSTLKLEAACFTTT